MQYLIYFNKKAVYTNWFSVENTYCEGMIVFDLFQRVYTVDGKEWRAIEEDHL